MENISDRIRKIIENQGLSLHAFEKKIGAGNNVIGTSIKRNSHFSSATLSKILNSFPDISPEWLLTGKGSMLRDAQPTTPTPSLRDLPAISPCPELLSQVAELKAEKAQLHSIINSQQATITHQQSQIDFFLKHNKELEETLSDYKDIDGKTF